MNGNLKGRRYVTVVLVILAVFTLISVDAQAFRNVKPGDKVPTFSAAVAGGGSVDYAPPTEEIIVLAIVRQGQDQSNALIRDLAKVDSTLLEKTQILALVVNPDDGDAVAWASGLGADFPVLLDKDEKNYGLFGVLVAPETAIITPEGNLKQSISGHSSSTRVEIENYLREILGIKVDDAALKGKEVNIPPERKLAMRELQKAKMLMKRKMKKKAPAQVKKAIDADPTYLEAWLLYGELLLEDGDNLDEAETAYKKIGEIDPKEPMGKVGLARVRAKKGDYEGAAAELEKTAMVSPKSGNIYYYLGLMHEEAGKWENAAKAYRKSLEKCQEEKDSDH